MISYLWVRFLRTCGAATALLISACSTEDILVASIPTAAAGGSTSTQGPCASDADCPRDAFCEMSDCASALGQCAQRPTSCENYYEAVCGCDKITYWNDCLRKAAAVHSSRLGECAQAERQSCEPPNSLCPAGTFCARLEFESSRAWPCAQSGPGSCWALPGNIPTSQDSIWVPCSSGGQGDPLEPGRTNHPEDCVDAWTAIRSELPHRRVPMCSAMGH